MPPRFVDPSPEFDPQLPLWAAIAGSHAAELADRWRLQPDGEVMNGWMAVVWPVLDEHGARRVLKLARPDPLGQAEGVALAAWHGRGAVRLHRHDQELRAVLLDRLDRERTLGALPIDEADTVVGDLLTVLRGVDPPAEVVSTADELTEWLDRLTHVDPGQDVVPQADLDRAKATLADHIAEQRRPETHPELLHFDLHHENVLHTLDQETGTAWRAIDPLPLAGRREWELLAPLRNRWADALATGDPDRALRRRLDRFCERADLDREVAVGCAQAAAVDNLLTVLPGNDDAVFNPPFAVMAGWTGR